MADIKWSDLWKGEYSASTQYEVSDTVSYQGSSYTCILRPTVGTAPTNTTYWKLISQKGDTGAQGDQGIQGIQGPEGLVWKGAYSGATAYVIDDAVSYNGSSYICIQASTGNLPTDTNYWQLLAQKGADGAGTGDVSGPASATNNGVPLFDGTTGKLIKDSAKTLPTGAIVGASDTQTLTNKTLTSPKINEDVAVTATATEINLLDGKTALGAFWDVVPGTPTRVSDTQFTLTDTGNANKYDLLLKKGVILKWDESGTTNIAMVISSSYATNVVTVNIVGDSLTAGFTSMKYCIQMAMVEQFIIPGTLGTGTDLAKTWYPSYDVCKLSVDARVKTAGTTNPTDFDVNDDGTTIITTKPSIASGATADLDNVCDAPTTVIAANSAVTVDIDAVSTTPPVEAYIYLFYFPSSWLYRN